MGTVSLCMVNNFRSVRELLFPKKAQRKADNEGFSIITLGQHDLKGIRLSFFLVRCATFCIMYTLYMSLETIYKF